MRHLKDYLINSAFCVRLVNFTVVSLAKCEFSQDLKDSSYSRAVAYGIGDLSAVPKIYVINNM